MALGWLSPAKLPTNTLRMFTLALPPDSLALSSSPDDLQTETPRGAAGQGDKSGAQRTGVVHEQGQVSWSTTC